jgi:hypothetical protein
VREILGHPLQVGLQHLGRSANPRRRARRRAQVHLPGALNSIYNRMLIHDSGKTYTDSTEKSFNAEAQRRKGNQKASFNILCASASLR